MRIFKVASLRESGFTLIELLVVVAILGAIAAMASLSVGSYVNKSKTIAYENELSSVRTALQVMIVDSEAGELDTARSDISDMDLVTADSGAEVLSSYMVGLDSDGAVKLGCTYSFTISGTVTQTTP